MNCFIGLDIGTSAVKGVALSQDGKVLAEASGAFRYKKDDNSSLLEPSHFVQVCCDVIKKLSAGVGSDYQIAAICPCGASGNLVFLDAEMKPITDIIGWQSSIEEEELSAYYTEEDKNRVYQTVGWPAINSFPVAYFPWIRQNRPDILERSSRICMSVEYLNFKLTGKWGIAPSMGTPFYLMDQEKGVYAPTTLAKFGISEEKLPPIYDKGTVLGTVTSTTAESLGLSEDTVIVLGSFDHPSCATGAGVYECDEVLLSCGTSWVEFFPVESRERAIATGFLVDRYMLDGAPYCVMSSIASLSVKIDALKDRYLKGASYAEVDALASSSEKGCGGLEFDFTDADFTKAEGCERRHIARAIYESAARLLSKNFAEAEEKGLCTSKVTMVGGITNSRVCMQIIADTIQKDIKVVNGVLSGAAGAAMLAGIGAKVFRNEKDAFSKMNFSEVWYHADTSNA